MNGAITIGAALLLGLMASAHCVVMCGGISGALGLVTAKRPNGTARPLLLITYQVGRITSYALAGFFVGSIGDALLSIVDVEGVRSALRVMAGAALGFAALAMLGLIKAPGLRLVRLFWPSLARAGRRLMPIVSVPRAFAFGMLWGWMPCGLAYSVLLVAALSAHPMRSAAIMLAFGLGTLPTMLAVTWATPRIIAWTSSGNVRRVVGYALLMCALATMAAPWLVERLPMLHAWLPFDCTPDHS